LINNTINGSLDPDGNLRSDNVDLAGDVNEKAHTLKRGAGGDSAQVFNSQLLEDFRDSLTDEEKAALDAEVMQARMTEDQGNCDFDCAIGNYEGTMCILFLIV